jgi:hypothetical protein
MFCPKCGTTNDDAARFCSACGTDLSGYRGQPAAQPQAAAPVQPAYQPPVQQVTVYQQPNQAPGYQPMGGYGMVPRVATHMAWAIISLIFFFWPTAIPAIVNASRVNNRLAMGDTYGAQEASRKAKMWCWISFAIAIVWVVIVIIMYVAVWRTAYNIYY